MPHEKPDLDRENRIDVRYTLCPYRNALLVVCLATCILVGCTSPKTSAPSTEALDQAELAGVMHTLDFAFSAEPGFYTAKIAAYLSCMRSQGFAIPDGYLSPPAASASANPLALYRLEEITRSDAADGASPPSATDGSPVSDRLSLWISALSPGEQARYGIADLGNPAKQVSVALSPTESMSFPGDGCEYSSIEHAWGDPKQWYTLNARAQALKNDLWGMAQADHLYLDALSNWRTCMQHVGLPTDSLGQAEAPSAAVADWDCRASAHLRETRIVALRAAVNKRATSVNAMVDEIRTAVAAAKHNWSAG